MIRYKYTDEAIIEAMRYRARQDTVCREGYELLQRQKTELERLRRADASLSRRVIDWCREKIKQEKIKKYDRMTEKALDGYEKAMLAVMSHLSKLSKEDIK